MSILEPTANEPGGAPVAAGFTELCPADKGLHDSEAKLQVIFDGVEAGIFLIDSETHRIVDANALALKLIGAPRDHVVGAVCHKFVCPADQGKCPFTDLGQKVDNSERVLLTTTGERLPIIKTVRRVVIGGRQLLLESFVDISAQKRAELSAREAEQHFRSLFASIPAATFFFDAETLQYLEVNDAAIASSGYSRDEFLKMRVTDLTPKQFVPRMVSTIQALGPGARQRDEEVYQLRDGQLIDVEVDVHAVDFCGQRAVLAVAQDVTERKRAEVAMAERHRLAKLLADVGVELTRAETLRQGLQRCAEILVSNIGIALARVWTVNDQGSVLELQASAGMYTHIDGGHSRIPMGKLRIGRIAESGELQVTNSVDTDPLVEDPEWVRREGMVAFAGYPLKVEEQVLGVLAVFARQRFTETTFQAMASVADNIAQFTKRKRAEKALRESEDRYRDLVENSSLLIGTHDAEGRLLNANCSAARVLEAANPQELVQRSLADWVPPDLLPQFDEYLKTILREGHAEGLMVMRTPSGKRKIIEYRNTLRRQDQRAPIVRWTGQDVTERILAEEAMRASENRYRHLFERNLAGVLSIREGLILDCNESLARMLGYDSPQELLGTDVRHIWNDPTDHERLFAELKVRGNLNNHEVCYRRKDGKPMWVLLNIQQTEPEGGASSLVEGTVVDITQRKQAEERLLLTQFSIEHASDAVAWLDSQSRIVYVNEESCRSLGRSREELLSSTLADINPDFLPGDWEQTWAAVKATGSLTLETHHITKSGKIFPVEVTSNYLEFGGKEYCFTFSRDIAQRKQAEEKLLLTQFSIEHGSDATTWLDSQGRIVYVNEESCRSLGRTREELLSSTIADINPDFVQSSWQKEWERLKAAGTDTFEARHITKLGRIFPVEVTANFQQFGGNDYLFTFARDITQRQEAERQIKLQVTALEAAANGMVITDQEGQILWANPAFTRLTGYPASEVVGKSLRVLKSGAHDAAFYKEIWHTVLAGRVWHGEVINRRKDGTLYTEEMTITPVHDRNGTIVHFIAVKQDITERKRAEDMMVERHRLATLVAEIGEALTAADSIRQGLQHCAEVLVKNMDAAFARIWTVNDAEKVLELQASAGMYTHINGAHARIPIGKFKIGRIAESGEPHLTNSVREDSWTGDQEWARRERMVAFAGYPLKVQGRLLGVVAAFARKPMTDATLQGFASAANNISQFIRRKRAEEALLKSKERFRLLFEQNLAGVFRCTTQGRLVECNIAYARILGYESRQEALEAVQFAGFDDPTDLKIIETRMVKARLAHREALSSVSIRLRHKNQTSVWALGNVSLIEPAEGEDALISGTIIDITKHKQAEETLAQERELLRALMENVPDCIYFKDRESRFLRINAALAQRFGFSDPAQAIGKSDFDFYAAEHAQPAYDDEQQVINTGQPMAPKEEKETWSDGRVTWASTTKQPLRDAFGNIVGTFGVSRDITDRKRAEEALRESEEGLAAAQRIAHIGSWYWNVQTDTAHWSDETFRIFGLTSGQLEDHRRAFLDLIHPEDRTRVGQSLTDALNGTREYDLDFRIRLADGTEKVVHGQAEVLKDEAGKPLGLRGVTHDITERKRAEAEVYQSRQMLQSILDNIPQRVFWKDRNLAYLGCNRAFALDAMLPGPAEIIGKNDFELAWKESAELYRADDTRVMEQESAKLNFEERQCRPDGSFFWLRTNKMPFRDREGKVIGVIGTYEDITERKLAEEELLFKTALLEAESETSLDGVLVVDEADHVVLANRQFGLHFGVPNEVLSTLDDLMVRKYVMDRVEDPDTFIQGVEYLNRNRDEKTRDELRFKDGRVFDRYSAPLQDAKGKYYGRSWYFRDITERLQAEQNVRESNELISLLLDSIPEAVYGIDMHGNCTFCNPACLQLIGYQEAADLHGRDMHAVLHHTRQDGTPYPVEECHIYEAFHRGHGTHIDDEVLWRRDGSNFPAEYWSRPIHRHGTAIGAVVTFIDITERKRAEEQTRLQTAALESAANGIAIADQQGRILWINPAFTRLTGYSAAEIVGQTMRSLKSGEQNADFYQNLWQTILSGEVWQGELTNRRKDGTLYSDFTTITPVRDASGTLTHFVAIKQDVTERRRAEEALEERTAYLNTLFEISPMGIVVLDTEGCVQMTNSVFEKLFQYSRQEIKGAKLDEFIVPANLASEARSLTSFCISGPGVSLPSRRRRKDGTLVDVDIYGVPLIIENQLRGILTLYQDITERKRAEAELMKYAEDLEVSKTAQEEHAQELARLVEELARERDLLGTLMDNLPDFIFYKDRQSRLVRTNPAHAKALGLSGPLEAVGKTDFDFFPEEEAKNYARDEQRVFETGQPLIGQIEKARQPDGQYLWYFTSKVPIRDGEGQVIGLVGISRDITERMVAEEKIRDSEAKYRSLVSNIPDVIWTIDAAMQIAFLSPNIERLSGFSLEEHYRRGGELYLEKVHPEDVLRVKEGLAALFAKSEPYDVECRVLRKDGEWIWIHDRAVASYEKNGVRYADGLLSDITPSKRAEEGLRASEERYRELFENASDIVYTSGLDMRMTSLNRVGQQILGYSAEEATRLNLQQLVSPKHWEIINRGRERLLAGEFDVTLEVEVTTKDGRPIMLEVKPRLIYRGGKPVGVQGIGRDITGRDAAELELRHAQKLESVGRLASGIAHELNTPIQFVGDNTRFLQDSFGGLQTLLNQYQDLRRAAESGQVSPELLAKVSSVEEESDCAYMMEEIPKALSQTLDGVTRVATIVRAMKEFAHPEGKEMAAADLNRALLSTLTVARNELKYVADVETEFGDLPLVVCNIGDINQVFLNLLVNAAHAIAESTKGTTAKGKIQVRTVPEGATVLVSIADSGCGIPEANRTKVFDPFFTTKEVGRGTGQGLAIARSVVVDRHKGMLSFESEMGKGTTFYVRLPIDPGQCSKEAKAS